MAEITTQPEALKEVNDLSIITGYRIEASSTSTATNHFEDIYFRAPILIYIIFLILFMWVAKRFLLELIIRWRN